MSHKTPAEPQNIYDDPAFFAGYRALRQNDTGLNGALEGPALRSLLPDLVGLTVLDLGCGFGDFARFARGRGAAAVTGLDISERMLEEAGRLTDDAGITYVRASIEDYQPAPGAFDLAVSSLALHYVADYSAAAARIFDALAPGGRFVFSVEHPICTAAMPDWTRDASGAPLSWPVDRYREEGRRDTRWFVGGVVKYHRTIETYVTGLIAAGFQIGALAEPPPTAAALAARPELALHLRRPPFLLLSARRPA